MQNKKYKSDVSDSEWSIVGPRIPEPKTNGRRATIPRRRLLDALFYVTKTGCGWEWLPHDFPNGKTVYHSFRLWRLLGLWHHIHDILRTVVRKALGRTVQPRAALIDSQSAKTTYVGGPERGFDGGKKVNGRKRHLVSATQGLVRLANVPAANIVDRDGAPLVRADMPTRYPLVRKI